MGRLSNDDGHGNENDKEATGLDEQNNNFIRAPRFFVHSWPSLHDCDRKLSNFTRTLYGVGEHSAKFSFFFFHQIRSFWIQPQTRISQTFDKLNQIE